MHRKDEKAREIVKALAGDFLQRESNGSSMVTVTDVEMGDQGRRATVYFTVLPVDKEHAVVEFLVRKRGDFQSYVREKSRIGRVPLFDFAVDKGEKHRQRIDELMR
ncbi:MAG: ribosome-binding factor A [bacterium]